VTVSNHEVVVTLGPPRLLNSPSPALVGRRPAPLSALLSWGRIPSRENRR
jgi:hypothetical protein